MCGSLEKRGDGDRQRDRETETDLDLRVLSDSFGAVGPKKEKGSLFGSGRAETEGVTLYLGRRIGSDLHNFEKGAIRIFQGEEESNS